MALVSVICLCYNHADFVEEAVLSVINQSYSSIELILVDDASTDTSVGVIYGLKKRFPSIQIILHTSNQGLCKSFNEALALAKGSFIIDLAADDVLLSNRVEAQVKAFESLDDSYGIVFSDAFLTDEQLAVQGTFYKRDSFGKLSQSIPKGNVFSEVVHSYTICSPTIMSRKSLFDKLGGYDEELSYEDYDFLIRSARTVNYFYIDQPLMYKREVKGSHATSFYSKKNNPHLESTLICCKKALWLCKDEEERKAVRHSVRYHFRQSYFMSSFPLALRYYQLLKTISKPLFIDRVIVFLVSIKFNVNMFYVLYLKVQQ